ncbi:DUF4179 domain-containing protein [Sutcliffiella cohnii]|uniref:DUF4179 domain-containing protein n=1 Tax=Sutcliffiella cohnii TaxID=33932 RepID=UPI002E232F84|nr:DUF4179 domain-containing protein [Sutcliffiella cohnii]
MFEKEEGKLEGLRKKYNDIPIPPNVDEYILSGIRKEKRRRATTRWKWGAIAASIFFIVILTSIRVSPTFADYVSSIPGLQKIVDIVRNDKGLVAAIENDYMQEINKSVEKNGITLTVDAIIMDEDVSLLFYTIVADQDYPSLFLNDPTLISESGEDLQLGYSYSSHSEIKKNEPVTGILTIADYKHGSIPESLQFRTNIKNDFSDVVEDLHVSFSYDKEKFAKIKKVYEVDQTITVEDQKIYVDRMEIRPTRIVVYVEYNNENKQEIFGFDDIQLVDGNGEVWTPTDGLVYDKLDENKIALNFQSNYFAEPNELFLTFTSLRALPKEEIEVTIDLEKNKIVNAPKDGKLAFVDSSFWDVTFELMVDEQDYYHHRPLFHSTFTDANGKEYSFNNSSGSSTEEGIHVKTMGGVNMNEVASPITLTISDYPNRLRKDVRLQLK